MKNMVYRLFTVLTVNGRENVTVHGYQAGENAQEALDSFLALHPDLADLPLHCVLWSWEWK